MILYLLDTNIISEPARPQPDRGVLVKLDEHADEIAIATPVLHELQYGVARMALGRKRERIAQYLHDVVSRLPVLPYDDAAAVLHAQERAALESCGLTPTFVDGQIAAVATHHNLTLVTRNTADFSELPGLTLENWFTM